ncbi:MAG: DUF2914 domain-containing protein [Desulfobacteraceae bacterium]|nr:DUF2914 domain-containing protein [Desulfobacteraceae bacterium]MBC2757445.1 DUF2914 domain-containing protein [Desulfobacteraceae bacterium]
MNRYIIEKRDKEVVEKFRAVVASKERRKKKARIRLFGVLLVIACAGLITFYKNLSQPPVPEAVMNKSNAIALNRAVDDSLSLQESEEIQVPAAEIIELSAISQDLNPQSPDSDIQSAELIIPEKKITPEPVPVLKPQVKTSGKMGLSEIPMQPARETNIRIFEIVTCQGVKNKRAVSRQNIFSLQKGAKPYVWMDVRSKQTPYKLRHVYYLNGRRYCEVPLTIHYPRMRTWSNVTLRNKNEAGQWRVDVVTRKGELLSQVEFTVVP